MADPERDVITILETLTISGMGALVEGTNVFRGPVMPASSLGNTFPVPQQAIFVRVGGSTPPFFRPVGGTQEKEWFVDIVIRGEPHDYGGARVAAQAVLDGVNGEIPDGGGYYYSKTQTSHPQWVDLEDSGAHVFVVTLLLKALEA